MTRELHLNAIFSASGGSLGGWRHPGAPEGASTDLRVIAAQARKLEAAAFDAIFIADLLAVPDSHPDVIERVATVNDSLEPVTLLAALSAVTERIGLIGTASSTYSEPLAIARAFASLDHLSRGRAGWNVVTSLIDAEARNHGADTHLAHADRYRRAEEFLAAVVGLWDAGSSGPLGIDRPVQGRPVIAQAGASPAGRDLAARYGELIFSGARRLDAATEYADDLRRRAAGSGRSPGNLVVLPVLSAVVAPTRAEAEDRFAENSALLHPRVALGDLEYWLGGVDLSAADPDGPLPDFPPSNRSHSAQQQIYDTARRENLTIRQFVERTVHANSTVVGTPEVVADHIQEWFEAGAADGFTVSFPTLPGALDAFVELVVPELRRRGLFRERYRGTTLREHLGLTRPTP